MISIFVAWNTLNTIFYYCVLVLQGPVPVKWMAVESLTHKVYTTKSDV